MPSTQHPEEAFFAAIPVAAAQLADGHRQFRPGTARTDDLLDKVIELKELFFFVPDAELAPILHRDNPVRVD